MNLTLASLSARRRALNIGVAMLLGMLASAPSAAKRPEPPVRRSGSLICHEKGTADYKKTLHFKSFNTIEDCLKSGGRLPLNVANKAPRVDASRPVHAGDDGAFFGPLVRVKDGDTLVVRIQGVDMDFRLSGIDSPEIDQPFGPEARNELAKIVGDQQCVLVKVDHDTYGRFVVYLWIGDLNVNREMMKRGMGWFDSAHGRDTELFELETEARDARIGLWALPASERVEPWVWRHEVR